MFGPAPETGPYDGTTFVNSGLQPLGPAAAKPFALTFAKPGTYTYHCVIHPNMVGRVVVLPAGGPADSAADVAARLAAEKARWVAEGRAAAQALAATPPDGTKDPDGTTTWQVKMGASTPHTDILAFAPVPVAVKAGDKVQFVNALGPIPLTYGGLAMDRGPRVVALTHSRRSPGVSIRRTGGELSSFPAVPAGPEYSLLPLPRIAR